MEIADTADLSALPGAGDLLNSLPAGTWAIVTSATRKLLIARLYAAHLPVPDLVISGDMVNYGKPDPEPYRRGAELLQLPPSECLVVEDAPSGISSGVAAGCAVLGVEGTHSAEDLFHAGATWVAPSLASISVECSADGLSFVFSLV